ncbi:uncharacterized protein TrAtP1_000408 [Trichoderma atroviride]|uniref:uncharacterized protein n=1 Tax=Hypocrea atroviridis TaxID=63577 RepID=UPI00333004C9|nr:hypothetical protein TrAtP1_000408 [Trichoderma atroviride]
MPQARVSGGARPTTARRAAAASEGEVARQWLCGIDDGERSGGRGGGSAQGWPKRQQARQETKRLSKQQRAGQSDGRCESGHRRAGLAARPLIGPAGALSGGNGDSAQRDASERQGDALRQWIGGSWMRDVDADAGREMVFGDRYQHELWAAGGSACTAAQAIHELLLRLALVLVWGLGEADAVDTAVLTSVLCRGLVCGASPGASPGAARAFCMAERCVHCPISRR